MRDFVGSRAPGILIVVLLAAELACVAAWALTGDARWGLGALLVGLVAILAALRSGG